MKASLLTFEKGLEDTRQFIRGLELESELVSMPIREDSTSSIVMHIQIYRDHILNLRTKKRFFDNTAIIISLYGLLERFIESLICAYIEHMNAVIPKYSDIPKEILVHHLSMSISLINHSELPKYKDIIAVSQVISNLHSCMNNESIYKVNAEAFAQHTSNFWRATIEKSFSQIGIFSVSNRIIKSPIFLDYIKRERHDLQTANRITPEIALNYLDTFVQLRNEIAHGEPPQLASNSILLDYVKFFEAYARALFEVIYSETLCYDIKYLGKYLGKSKKIFKRGYVIGISVKETPIRVGDLLVAQTNNKIRPFIGGEIEELQINSETLSLAPTGVDVGIKVPFRGKPNYSYFLIPKHM